MCSYPCYSTENAANGELGPATPHHVLETPHHTPEHDTNGLLVTSTAAVDTAMTQVHVC
jgi:hypothetical protein